MADIKLFSIHGGVNELPSTSVTLEKELQTLIEQNMQTFFSTAFIKSELSITNGRIDSLGLDENFCPVIFEYKRSKDENVINQGLFYLDWLLDHKADFKFLVMDSLGLEIANKIDWSFPQVICIASNFTKFDEHAVNQMQRNIKLVRYNKFGNDLIMFEHINTPNVKPVFDTEAADSIGKTTTAQKTFLQMYETAPEKLKNIYLSIKDFILSLGDDVSENQLKLYVAFRKVRNIACVEMYASKVLIHLSIDPKSVELIKGFTRDMSNIGHYGTGNLQVNIKSEADFEKAKSLIERAYNEN